MRTPCGHLVISAESQQLLFCNLYVISYPPTQYILLLKYCPNLIYYTTSSCVCPVFHVFPANREHYKNREY